MVNKCMGCVDRHLYCHDSCEAYRAYQEASKARSEYLQHEAITYPMKHPVCRSEHILRTHKHRQD